jgi:hypothetical protein
LIPPLTRTKTGLCFIHTGSVGREKTLKTPETPAGVPCLGLAGQGRVPCSRARRVRIGVAEAQKIRGTGGQGRGLHQVIARDALIKQYVAAWWTVHSTASSSRSSGAPKFSIATCVKEAGTRSTIGLNQNCGLRAGLIGMPFRSSSSRCLPAFTSAVAMILSTPYRLPMSSTLSPL